MTDEEISEDDDMSTEEKVEYTDDKVESLVNLLIKKGIITEEEFGKAYDELFEDDESDEK